ncbi:MAG: hypothetical protein ACYDEX_11175 [Mobilitalea sp.]
MNNNNNSNNTSSKKTGKSSTSENIVDYKYSPRVENPNPKSTTNKSPSSGNIKGV